jgi:hypothetical protein
MIYDREQKSRIELPGQKSATQQAMTRIRKAGNQICHLKF